MRLNFYTFSFFFFFRFYAHHQSSCKSLNWLIGWLFFQEMFVLFKLLVLRFCGSAVLRAASFAAAI